MLAVHSVQRSGLYPELDTNGLIRDERYQTDHNAGCRTKRKLTVNRTKIFIGFLGIYVKSTLCAVQFSAEISCSIEENQDFGYCLNIGGISSEQSATSIFR
jgi:hypothetical protein